ncbi:MAG: hypothetical protein AAFV33_03035 [Chloroflexota bacterium]
MSVTIHWVDTEQTTLCQQFSGNWTREEHAASYRELMETIEQKPYDVHLLVDFTTSTAKTSRILTSAPAVVSQKVAENIGMAVVVSKSPIMTAIKQMARVYTPFLSNIHFVETVPEARAILFPAAT